MSFNQVPVVNLEEDFDPQYSEEATQAIGASLEKWGFVSITGHGISPDLLEKAYRVGEELFQLTEEQKRSCEDIEGGRQRGYTPFLMERAKGQESGDLKEFWHIGRELSAEHPMRLSGLMRANLFPAELPHVRTVFLELYQAMDQLAAQMLAVIERYLGIDTAGLQRLAEEGNSVLRVLHYPDLGGLAGQSAQGVRAAAHEDINLLTLLPAATKPGLQLLTRSGDWLDVAPPEGAIILDTGDMMSAVTNGVMPATTHRVINPEGPSEGARFSMPFFMHPRPDAVLTPLIERRGFHHSVEGAGLTAQAFLDRRLQENGLLS